EIGDPSHKTHFNSLQCINKSNLKSIRFKLVAQLCTAKAGALFSEQSGSWNNFLFLTTARELNRNCCQNGGTCFLGTFCICPKYFTGRHCEHDKRIRLCGTVRHGEWTKDGCLFCQCVQGVLHCFPYGLQDGCGLSFQREAYLLTAPSLLTLLWCLL
uniref:EGF-like domain-containing protein n=1 Tax=Dromaius novaehollandiae TaxID=8790 RepID=A0A8C4JRM5_DRONO